MHKDEMLQNLAGGHFIDRLTEHLAEVTDEVLATGKTGTVTVTLKVNTPDKNVADPIATISVTFKETPPVKDAVTTGFYYYGNEFHRSPQSQQPFPEDIYAEDNIVNLSAKEETS